MSQWAERVRTHPVWQNMQSLGAAIDQAVAREGIDSQSIDGWERVRTVLAFGGKRLAGTDPQLLHPAPLDGIGTQVQNALTEAQTFASDGNPARAATANSYADTILSYVAAINYPFVADDWNVLRDAGVAYRNTLEKQLAWVDAAVKKVGTEAGSIQQRLAELTAEITAEKTRLTSLTSDFQAQFSTAQDTRGREFTEAQAARQERFGALNAEHTQRLTEQTAEFTKQREADAREYRDHLATLKTTFADKATAILEDIDTSRHQVEKLVGVIGNLGVTSGYLKTANQARMATWFWQGLTVLSLGGVIGVAYKAFLPLVQGAFTWESFAGRVFLSLTVGVLAAYAAAQADKQGDTERRNRKLALEFEAMGPYLAPLPVEKQEALRIQLAERSVGRDEGAATAGSAPSPATVVDMLAKSKDARDFITEIFKVVRG